MSKPINEIRDMLASLRKQAEPKTPNIGEKLRRFRIATVDVVDAVLRTLADHESLINRMDGELAKITDAKRSVPAEWYRNALRDQYRVRLQFIALKLAVAEFSDWSDHIRKREQEILAEEFRVPTTTRGRAATDPLSSTRIARNSVR